MSQDFRVRLFRGKALLTRSQYYRRLLLLWAWSLVWWWLLWLLWKSYGELPIWLTLGGAAVLIVLVPELTVLFRPYRRYNELWKVDQD